MDNSDVYIDESKTQSTVVLQAVAAATASNSEKNIAQKTWNYLKSRFDKDNWLGSVITPFVAYVNYNMMRAAQTREVNGTLSPDRRRELSAQLQMAEKTWSFFSERGGKFPEGKTVWQRMANAIKHPQISSTQFEYVLLLPAFFLAQTSNIMAGIKAYDIGLKQGETVYKPERIRLYSGIVQTTSIILAGIGHFRKHNPVSADEVSAMNESNGLLQAIKKMWKYDRILVTGSFINMISPSFAAFEAWGKAKKSRTEAIYLARGALVNGVINGIYGIYTFQRIAKSNFTKNKDTIEKTLPEIGFSPKADDSENSDGQKTKYTNRIFEERARAPETTIASYL